MNDEDSLWNRVAALRGLDLPKRGDRIRILGDRFQVSLSSRVNPRKLPERAARLAQADDPSCRGVIGEIVVPHGGPPLPAPVPRRRRDTLPYGWARA